MPSPPQEACGSPSLMQPRTPRIEAVKTIVPEFETAGAAGG